jgi:DNA-binding NarL/FixJ family response regulator
VLDATHVQLSYWTADERNVVANEAFARLFGRTPDDLRGLHLRDVLGSEAYDDDLEHIRGVLGGTPQRFERDVVGLDGVVRAQVACTPDVVGGRVVGFAVVVSVTKWGDTKLAADGSDASPVVRVLVVDDDPLARAGLGAIVGSAPGIEVMGESATVEEALAKIRRTSPDVVLIDVRLPRMDLLLAARREVVQGGSAFPEVVVLTTSDFDEYLFDPVGAGACDAISKRSSPEALLDRVRVAARATGANAYGRSASRAKALRENPLTRREREVLALTMWGLTNKEIAKRLFISTDTVKTHLKHLYAKLGVLDRQQLIAAGHEVRLR